MVVSGDEWIECATGLPDGKTQRFEHVPARENRGLATVHEQLASCVERAS